MPSNVEIKAALNNRAVAEAIAVRLSDSGPETIRQSDAFLRCDGARLKIRVLGPERGDLIRYERSDVPTGSPMREKTRRVSLPLAIFLLVGSNSWVNAQ
jgi:hypothetical protein